RVDAGLENAFEHHHVAQLLRRFSSDYATSRNISLDAALAHHLQQCSYHLRLFRSWLISGQDDLECLYGTARCSCLGPVLLGLSRDHCLLENAKYALLLEKESISLTASLKSLGCCCSKLCGLLHPVVLEP
uniref:Uncharacterized protein n=1 Tax=Strix occidentalis caurina TaxID=311401 RepID=A0A8D0EPM7_STROC